MEEIKKIWCKICGQEYEVMNDEACPVCSYIEIEEPYTMLI